MDTLQQFRQTYMSTFEAYLLNTLDDIDQERLKQAIHYSLATGGKRVRPLLLLATLDALGHDVTDGFAPAAALEYIHTYSLIHDDLPGMDDDNYRRGQLTSHKKFDEATAILAGDALQTGAFKWLTQTLTQPQTVVRLVQLLSESAGVNGMIGGQMDDMLGESNAYITLEHLKSIHQRKTGKLYEFAVIAASLMVGCDESIQTLLKQFAISFGLAFQIHNDLKDVDQDEKRQKSTYVSLLGLRGAKEALQFEIDNAKEQLSAIKERLPHFNSDLLADFLDYLQ